MQALFSTLQGLIRALPVLGFALFQAAPASAQVDYVREIVPLGPISLMLGSTQAPYETSRPDYSTPASPRPKFATTNNYYSFDSITGVVSPATQFPTNVKLNENSIATFAGQNTPALLFFTLSSQRFLITFNMLTGAVVGQTPALEVEVFSSLAARNRDGLLLSLIADNQHFTVDRFTGGLNAQPLAGVDMSEAFYQSYGQDGLLHVLDYGNGRMASFDPDNAFAPVDSFDLEPGITTANGQFGIGINGSFYLADGLGGGSYYDAAGVFQGTFEVPEGDVTAPYLGIANYVSTDSAGRVYVFDRETGIHQYQDASVVPEPGTWGLLGLALFAFATRRKVRRTC